MGGAFILALVMPWWQTIGPASIRAPIRVQDTEYRDLIIEVHLGLTYANITLTQAAVESVPQQRTDIVLPRLLPRDSLQVITGSYVRPSEVGKIQFNEEIELKTAEEMREQFKAALERGLPVPILTVVNYLSHQEEGFRWSVDFRLAGFFCQFTLTLTLISWAWMNIFFLVIPQHGAIAMITTGLLALLSVFLYWILLPSRDMIININGSVLQFRFDGCYWTVLTTGLVALLTGIVLLIVEIQHPGSLTFDLELDPELKRRVINKLVEKRSVKLQQSFPFIPPKGILKPQISVIDGTKADLKESSISDTKMDSGMVSAVDSATTSGLLTRQLDSSSHLEQIATLDGSYFKSTVTNVRIFLFELNNWAINLVVISVDTSGGCP